MKKITQLTLIALSCVLGTQNSLAKKIIMPNDSYYAKDVKLYDSAGKILTPSLNSTTGKYELSVADGAVVTLSFPKLAAGYMPSVELGASQVTSVEKNTGQNYNVTFKSDALNDINLLIKKYIVSPVTAPSDVANQKYVYHLEVPYNGAQKAIYIAALKNVVPFLDSNSKAILPGVTYIIGTVGQAGSSNVGYAVATKASASAEITTDVLDAESLTGQNVVALTGKRVVNVTLGENVSVLEPATEYYEGDRILATFTPKSGTTQVLDPVNTDNDKQIAAPSNPNDASYYEITLPDGDVNISAKNQRVYLNGKGRLYLAVNRVNTATYNSILTYIKDQDVLFADLKGALDLTYDQVVAIQEQSTSKGRTINMVISLDPTLFSASEMKNLKTFANLLVNDGTSSSASRIILKDNGSFYAPLQIDQVDEVTYVRGAVGTRAAGDEKYYSITLPYTLNIVPSGIDVYQFKSIDTSKGVISFDEASKIEANKAYLYVTSSSTVDFSATDVVFEGYNASTDASVFRPSYAYTSPGSLEGKYALRNDGSGFGVCDDTAYQLPFRAFLNVDAETVSAKAFRIQFNNEATGISTLKDAQEVVGNNDAYNIAGQKVNSSYKGIVIKNGKKVIK